jgi:inner membrane protein
MVFIIEPLFWVAIGVPMALIMRWRVARVLGLAGLLIALVAFASRGYLGWPSFAGLLAIALVCGAVQWRAGLRSRAGLLLALCVGVGFIVLQGAASHVGRAQISAALQKADPASRVLDVSMTAFPSQPLCWAYVSVESDEAADRYRLRRGVASIAPAWLAPLACPAGLVEQRPSVTLASGIQQFDVAEASLRQLRTLKAERCDVDAWLRFARAPKLDAAAHEISDYRFASTPAGNFTALQFAKDMKCPDGVPHWGYPRADLLN